MNLHIRPLALALSLALCGIPLSAQEKIPVTSSSKSARTSFSSGQSLVDRLRLTDAIPHFQKAVRDDPDFALAHLYLALTSTNGPDFWTHLNDAVTTSANASTGEQLWINGVRAGAYGVILEQREHYTKLASLFPRDERAQTLLGIHYFGQQDYEKAARHLQRAVELAPEFTAAYNQLGYAYRFLGRYEESERTFRRYTELLPDDPNPYDSYAELLLKMGRFAEAVEQYRRALAVDENFANSHIGIAAAFVYQGDFEEARKELGRALDHSRNDGETRGALFALAVTHVHEGNMERAIETFRKQHALGEKTSDAGAMAGDCIAIGNILLESGRVEEAFREFTRARELVESSSLAAEVKANAARFYRYNYGRVLVANGYYNDAVKEAREFLKEAERVGNANQKRLAHELAGIVALARNEYAEAIQELQQASAQNPYNLYRLAQACAAQGDAATAKEYARRAAEFNSLPALNYAFVRAKARTMLSAL